MNKKYLIKKKHLVYVKDFIYTKIKRIGNNELPFTHHSTLIVAEF